MSEYERAYDLACRREYLDRRAAIQRRYYQRHRELVLENDKAYRKANRAKITERKRGYYNAHKDRINEQRRNRRRANHDKLIGATGACMIEAEQNSRPIPEKAACRMCGGELPDERPYQEYCSKNCYIRSFDKYRR
jgi:hypothetical protein